MEMYKNETMYVVELDGSPWENVMQAFYQGADIVFFTKEQKFVGGGGQREISNDILMAEKLTLL